MKLIKIPITQQCIDNGNRNSLTTCPVALAIKSAVKDDCVILVTVSRIYVTLDKTLEWEMEEWLIDKIKQYDNTGVMSEFDIYLPLTKKYLRK